jgi:hypothetical protein
MAEAVEPMNAAEDLVDLTYEIQLNEWNGR